MPLVIAGATSGSTTIQATDGATQTITLPSNTGTIITTGSTGGVIPKAALPSGSVLQAVSFRTGTQGSTTLTTSDTATNPVIEKTITPVGNGSKFRIDLRWFGETSGAWEIVAHIYRNGVRINETNTTNVHGLAMATQSYGSATNDDSTPEILTLFTLDETGSTAGTQITYKLMFSADGNRTCWTNRCFNSIAETGVSEIIITEYAG